MSEILTAEDIAFLKDLANQLATQDTACTAKPVYYSILEKNMSVGINEAYADGMVLGGCEGESFTEVQEAIDFIAEGFDEEDDADRLAELRECEDLESVYDFCENNGVDNMHYTGYRMEDSHKEMFLTKAALKEHVRLNHYHYKEPVSYCHHAWRNPELERLLSIIGKFKDEEVQDESR